MTNKRGSGKTTQQIIAAPIGSIYVWPHPDTRYPRMLAKQLGRTDLQFVSPGWLRIENIQGRRFTGIVSDHEVCENGYKRLTDAQYNALEIIVASIH